MSIRKLVPANKVKTKRKSKMTAEQQRHAAIHLTTHIFSEDVVKVMKDSEDAKRIFVSVENQYAAFIENETKKTLEAKGHSFNSFDEMIQFMESNCELLRDDTLPNPLNVLKLNGEVLLSWNDFADTIGHISKKKVSIPENVN